MITTLLSLIRRIALNLRYDLFYIKNSSLVCEFKTKLLKSYDRTFEFFILLFEKIYKTIKK